MDGMRISLDVVAEGKRDEMRLVVKGHRSRAKKRKRQEQSKGIGRSERGAGGEMGGEEEKIVRA